MNSHYRTPSGAAAYLNVDFDQTPFTVAWEMTRACALNCIHCRAEAQKKRNPQELTTPEGMQLIDQIVEMGKPILIFTGGDPLMRRDVYDLISYAASSGLRVGISPSATKLVNKPALTRLKEAGVHMAHVSLDGSTPWVHDTFRGFRGSFDRTLEIMEDMRELEIPIQIGTTVSRHNLDDLAEIARLVQRFGITVWSVFFLVPTGRGKAEDVLSAQDHERTYNWLYDLSKHVPFHIRTTAAPAYRRVVIQRTREDNNGPDNTGNVRWELTGAGYAFREGKAPTEKGVNDGKGFCFIDHLGNVAPSGFLQLNAGNVREQSIADIYRHSQIFKDLRASDKLKGKCGVCEFKDVCGGSRARAYAFTGDYLAAEPTCAYRPNPA